MKTNVKKQCAFFSAARKAVISVIVLITAACAVAAQNTFPDSGNAGVGTTTPALQSGTSNTMVEVRGTVNPGVALTSTATGGRQYFVYSSQTNPGQFRIFDATASADRFVINNNGNVGIGTIAPTRKLDVRGDINTSQRYRIDDLIVLSTEGANNLFVGESVGAANTSGQDNAFFGRAAGFTNTTGSNNSFFGRSAGNLNLSGSNNSFFGRVAGNRTTGDGNSFFGTSAGLTNTTGDSNTVVGSNADVGSVNLRFATAIGSGAVVTSNNTIVLGRANGQDSVRSPGILVLNRLGTNGNTQEILCLNANDQVSSCTFFSSLRYKRQVRSFNGGLNLVRQLRPISFRWKTDGTPDVGFGAEEVAKIAPLFVTRDRAGEIQGVKYDKLSAVLVSAIQEQQLQLEARDARIADLETRLAALERVVLSGQQSAARPRQSRATISAAASQARRTQTPR